jgi:hypothetical protein
VVDLQRQDHPRSVIRIGHHEISTSSNLTCREPNSFRFLCQLTP